MSRRIKKARIKFISLVPKGANRMPVIYKSDDDSVEFLTLTKAPDSFDELGELLAVVYAPESRDSQGDIASAEVIRDMAHNFQKEGAGIDIRHDGKPVEKDQAYVAENFVIQKDDPRFGGMTDYSGDPVDVTGGWGVVIKIEDPDLRKAYREGAWNGVSMGGVAEVEPDGLDKEAVDRLVAALAKRLETPAPTERELEMDKKEMVEALAEFRDELVKALKPEAPKAEEVMKADSDTAPEFVGDITDKAALQKHAKKLRAWKLRKEIDLSDPEAIEDLAKALEDDGVEDEVTRLKKRLAKLEGRSNLDESTSTTKEDGEVEEIKKSASRMAEMYNQRIGTADKSGLKKQLVNLLMS